MTRDNPLPSMTMPNNFQKHIVQIPCKKDYNRPNNRISKQQTIVKISKHNRHFFYFRYSLRQRLVYVNLYHIFFSTDS